MVVIVDFGVSNLGSIRNMIKKVGGRAVFTSEPAEIRKASKLIFPGVGSFDSGMASLNDSGLIPILEEKVFEEKVPLLGVCLGMQLLTKSSVEGQLPGLGWINGKTKKFDVTQNGLKSTHMGWSRVKPLVRHQLTKGLDSESRFYFVHSYYVDCEDPKNILFQSEYGCDFTAGLIKDNIYGVQFHPEKSHRFGMQFFSNFLEL